MTQVTTKIERALISVSDKAGIVDFARELGVLGIEILSTGGTAKLLREQGVSVKDVSEFTGFPEMLDGRVKTLHPKVHGGLLGLRDNEEHARQMEEHGIEPIDLVVVNLYPFEATIKKPGVTLEEAIENIDIGGPTMLRSSAKNYRHVTVVVDPSDYRHVLEEIKANGDTSEKTRFTLAAKVYAHTARYDSLITNYLTGTACKEGEADTFPPLLSLQFEKVQDLRYGENPHQKGAFYREFGAGEPCVAQSKQLQGKEMSFNNYLDANSALELAREFSETVAVIIKHNNPCGVAVDASQAEAYRKARSCDPVSAFGGVLAFNRRVDAETAKEITSTFVEVVVAPGFDADALEVFAKKGAIRLLDVGDTVYGTPRGMDMKKVVGGLIYQDRDLGRIEDVRTLRVGTKRKPTDDEYAALAFAWKVCKHVKSNAIIYARPDMTVGIGAGQMSRVDSSRLGVMKAQFPVKGTAVASDAFFPFRDGIDVIAEAGVTAIIQPGGSVKDDEVIAAADEHGIAMLFTGMRHFRH
ncbi:MAG: bifunctional phosphoribosylaminoimidazolecarboxamide formyltransferase/IMP cyclohydrolase [Nitrospirota bacterium]|nr:bifunctional phosphoribosylaminoimidazolecarboxamide formyltransferase/IMP cyclohydrolase [Nitrospirota bacterium]